MQQQKMAAPLAQDAAHENGNVDAQNVAQSAADCNTNHVRVVHVSAHAVDALMPFIMDRINGPRPHATYVRQNQEERDATFALDVATGMIGEASLFMLFHGEHLGLHLYLMQRQIMRGYGVTTGDCGSDVAGLDIDLKTSYWRNKNISPLSYNLILPLAACRKPEHMNRTYALALAEELEGKSWLVHHVGWTQGCFIEPAESWRFKNCVAVEGRELCPWPPLAWSFGGAKWHA